MKHASATIIFTFMFWCSSFAQSKNVWTSFWNKDTTLIGFKDKTGAVKIMPKFNSFTTAVKFENIIAVAEEKGGRVNNYYLTKQGKIVGKGQLYTFDNGADCESEGYIRFRDKTTHRVGMFNKNGEIAIPANYDDLKPVRNGMVMALSGGHWDASKQSEHNQFPWVGSKQVLIDIHNKVLIENFPLNENINFFSLLISKKPYNDPLWQTFKGTNGKYYSFMNFDKEFKAWLKNWLQNDLTEANLVKVLYKDIYFWNESKEWLHKPKVAFANKNFKLIKSKLLELKTVSSEYEVFTEGLNPYIYKSQEFEKYFNNCGASMDWIYPVKTVVINHEGKAGILQDQFGFLRTESGYKLIEVSVRTGRLY